jgi:antitoxin ParD1/3/4
MNIVLSPDVEAYINEKVAAGVYPSVSEAIRDGVRLMKERDALDAIRLQALRAQIAIGTAQIESGDVVEYTKAEEFLQAIQTGGRQLLAIGNHLA